MWLWLGWILRAIPNHKSKADWARLEMSWFEKCLGVLAWPRGSRVLPNTAICLWTGIDPKKHLVVSRLVMNRKVVGGEITRSDTSDSAMRRNVYSDIAGQASLPGVPLASLALPP